MSYSRAMGETRVKRGAGLWASFLVLGALLWLGNAGMWSNPLYTLLVVLAVFLWFGYVVRDRALTSGK